MRNNWVAKNMHNYNKPSVIPDKRDKHLQDAYEREMDDVDSFPDEDHARSGGGSEE